jgi:para-aminobenzoate synthetase component 1
MFDIEIIERPKNSILVEASRLCQLQYSLFFDSNDPKHPENKWSFLCFDPLEVITAKNGEITHNHKNIGHANIFDFLKSRMAKYEFPSHENIPFTGGMAGYWGYDLGRQLEDLPDSTKDDLNLPDMVVGIYSTIFAYDHKNKKNWLIRAKSPQDSIKSTKTSDWIAEKDNFCDLQFEAQTNDDDYKNNIQKIIDYIHAGEVYQANYSRRFDTNIPENFNMFKYYERLRKINPAPFSSFMNFGDFQLICCSPERFLKVEKNQVYAQPIKGTLPSTYPAEVLENSQKDRAENLMIVDLLRNDLSKICDHHSVKVPKLCELQTFEGLHHLVSTVTGTLKKDKTALDLLKSCFPGGSITGAPKIRAMEIIEELEKTRRGPYCGAMGYIGFDGNMDTNIIIRTLIHVNGKAYLQTGSGIVSDSIPEKELQEGLDKAQKIFESFETKDQEDVA